MSQDCEIKQLLKNYKLYKLQASIDFLDNKIKDKINWLEKVINALDEEDRFLIESFYMNKKVSVNVLARSYYCSRRTIYRKIDKLLSLIEDMYCKTFKDGTV